MEGPHGGQFGEQIGPTRVYRGSLLDEIDLVLAEMTGGDTGSGPYENQGPDLGSAEPSDVRRAMDEPGPGEAI